MISGRIGDPSVQRLDVQQSWWAMEGIGDNGREWTVERKFEELAKAGFTGLLGRLPDEREAERWRRLLDEYRFSFGVHAIPFPGRADELLPILRAAKQFGVSYVNVQVKGVYASETAALERLTDIVHAAKEEGVPLFVETHRGRITQDLLRTIRYVRELPELRLTADLSHYVVAGAMEGYCEETENLFDELLQRTFSIHARISNGHQVQVDVREAGTEPMQEHFERWWTKAMDYWLWHAGPGDAFPFVCELGPPCYALSGTNDRYEQSLLLKDLGRRLWNSLHGT